MLRCSNVEGVAIHGRTGHQLLPIPEDISRQDLELTCRSDHRASALLIEEINAIVCIDWRGRKPPLEALLPELLAAACLKTG